MAFTTADLTSITSAISKGARKVKMSNGNEIEYASISDMLMIKEQIEQDLGLSGTKTGFVSINPNTGI